MKRLVLLSVAVLALGAAAPAWAHEEINPSSVPTGKPVFFTLSAANEKQVNLTKMTLTAPQGLAFGAATREPAGWTANKTDTVVTWTGGAVKPDQFETWGFEIEGADQPGTLTYKVTLGYADGSTDDVQVPITAHAGTDTSGRTTSSSGGQGRANAALAVAIVALLAAVGAGVVAARRGAGIGGGGSGAGGPGAGGPGSGAAAAGTATREQDW